MKKVLIVEDDLSLRQTLVDEFERQSIKVLEASNGLEGLKTALKEQPDLILLDIVMPVMDGLEMLEKVRAEEKGRDMRVVILTNFGEIDKIASAVEKGACSYLVKTDMTVEDIVQKATQFLEK